MLKKTITYEDYNGVERTEDFYFNLSKSEIVDWELGVTGGLSEIITRIVNAKEVPELVEYFQKLILKAYGEKSPDGKRFIKSDEISEAFKQTPAYDKLYMDLVSDDVFAVEFIHAIVPKDVAQLMDKETKNGDVDLTSNLLKEAEHKE